MNVTAIDTSTALPPSSAIAGAVCELAVLLGCDLRDVWASSESSFAPFVVFVVRFTHRAADQIDDMPIDNFLG